MPKVYSKEEKTIRHNETIMAMKLLYAYCEKSHRYIKDVAEELGFNRNTVSKWSNGSAVASAVVCKKIVTFVMTADPSMKDEDISGRTGGVAPYPTIDLNKAEEALSQHLCSPAEYAKEYSLGPNYFTEGVKGVDFAIKAGPRKILGLDFQSGLVFMVRTHCYIPDGARVLVFAYPDKETDATPPAVVACGYLFRNESKEEFSLYGNIDDETGEHVGKPLGSWPVMGRRVLGIYLIQKAQKNERNTGKY